MAESFLFKKKKTCILFSHFYNCQTVLHLKNYKYYEEVIHGKDRIQNRAKFLLQKIQEVYTKISL